MTIVGKFESDENFVTVYAADNCIYTLARCGGNWGRLKVGEISANGQVLTQERFWELADSCQYSGTFELTEYSGGEYDWDRIA